MSRSRWASSQALGGDLCLDGRWKAFAGFQALLLVGALLPSRFSQEAALGAYVLILFSALFLPFNFSSLSIVVGIFVGNWLAPSLPAPLDAIASRIVLQTWLAVIGLIRARPWQLRVKTNAARHVIIYFIIMIMIDFISLYRGTRILAGDENLYWMRASYTTQIGSYIRFISIILIMYRMGYLLNLEDSLLFSAISVFGSYVIGVSIAFSVLRLAPETPAELMLARISGLTDPNVGTVPMAMSSMFFIVLLFNRNLSVLLRSLLLFLSLIGVVGIMISGSRTAMITFLIGFLIFILLKQNLLVLIVSILLLALVWSSLPGLYQDRMRESNLQEDRLDKFEDTWAFIQRNMVIGGGNEVYRLDLKRQGAHNTPLHLLANGGLILLFPWVACLILFTRTAWRFWKNSQCSLGMIFILFISMYIISCNGLILMFYGSIVGLCFSGLMALMLGHLSRGEFALASSAKPVSGRPLRVGAARRSLRGHANVKRVRNSHVHQ
jgi:O-antigen ligase